MAQVILVAEPAELRDLLALNLGTQLGVEVINRKNAQAAIELLQLLPSIEVIIANAKIFAESTGLLLKQFIEKQGLETELILIGDNNTPLDPALKHPQVITIDDAHDWKQIIRLTAQVLGVNEIKLEESALRPDYYPIPLTYFLPLDRSCCDAYIRIKKGPGEFQYVKRIHRGDPFDAKTIHKYLQQGLSHFHIPYDQKDQFANDLSNQLVIRLDKIMHSHRMDEIQLKHQIELIGQSYDIVAQEIIHLGFNPATIQLTESVVDSMRKTALNHPEMSPLLHKVINSETSFIYQHAHMSAIVAIECLKNMGQFNEEDALKLTYAAFFQNIALIDQEELAQIYTQDQLEAIELGKELSDEEWDSVFFHAREAALMVQKFPGLPIEVDEIIRYHHGAHHGKGLTASKVEAMGVLPQVFIVANNFAHELLYYKMQGGNAPPRPIIEILRERFPQASLQVAIKAIEQTLKKNKSTQK